MVSIMVSKTIDVGSIPAAPAKSPQTRLGFFLAKFIQQLKHKVVASVPQESCRRPSLRGRPRFPSAACLRDYLRN